LSNSGLKTEELKIF